MKSVVKVISSHNFNLKISYNFFNNKKEFQVYIEQSKYDPYNVRTRLGNWRQLTLRSNQNNEILAIVVFDKHELTEVCSILLKLLNSD